MMKASVPKLYRKAKDRAKLYKEWRTFQISDHRPLWIELTIDFTEGYLATRGGFDKQKATKK